MTVDPSFEQERANLSQIASFSNISQSLPFTPYWITIFCRGFFALQTSHILTVKKSRVTIYFPLLINSPLEQEAIISAIKFIWWETGSLLKVRALLECCIESRRSHMLRLPLLVPQIKMLSEVGWSLEKVMLSLMSSRLPFPSRSTATQGLSASSKPQRQVCTQSLDRRYSSLLVTDMELMLVRCLLGKVLSSCEVSEDSTFCSLGMLRSFPADFTIFFSVFSQIFHSFMFLLLQVIIFIYLPWLASQFMPVISSEMSMLRRGSNSFTWDWNSVKYSYSVSFFLLLSMVQKMMILPALSPRLKKLPVVSNLMTEMISSSIIFSLGPLYPNSWLNLQLLALLCAVLSITFSSIFLILYLLIKNRRTYKKQDCQK